MLTSNEIWIILYVEHQQVSCDFYTELLSKEPELHVPGMTEFALSPQCKLGLMPNNGIQRIIQDAMPHPGTGTGIPRCELYLRVGNADHMYAHAIFCGAKAVSKAELRNWGDVVAYVADPDGHILAFAQ